jgi:hypothetical protein
MQGFNHIGAKSALNLPGELDPMIMIAIGHRGPVENLSDALQQREKPTPRKKLDELVFAGPFPG